MKGGRLSPGEAAPAFAITDLDRRLVRLDDFRGQTLLLSFFRYASCPLCNLRIQELIREYDRLAFNGLLVLAVFQSPAERIAHYVGRQLPPFAIIPDPELKLYRSYGVESSWSGFFRAWTLGLPKVVQAVMDKGFLPGSVEGDLNRIPADFVIGPQGELVDVYYGRDIGDHMPLPRVLQGLARTASYQIP